MSQSGCPKCHAIYHLLVHAEPEVVRRGVEALERGPGFGVLVAVPEELGPETEEEARAIEAASQTGIYVGVATTSELNRMVPTTGHDPEQIAGILAQLNRPPPEGQIHVLAVLDGCAATVTARASRAGIAAREEADARLARVIELLALAEPEVLARAAEASIRPRAVFVVVAPGDAMIARLPRAAAPRRTSGVHVGLHEAADVIAALPLEDLEVEDGMRAASRLSSPLPEGAVRVVALHDGHVTVVTRPPTPGFLAIS